MNTILDDYRRWLALGPGGLPANALGWAIASALRPLGRDTMSVDTIPTGDFILPVRPGSRPRIAPYPIPHRQLNEPGSRSNTDALASFVSALADSDRRRLRLARSRFERRGDALFVREDVTPQAWIARSRHEVVHVHSGEGSLHLVAGPYDAAQIISRGWGERHPLAGRPLLGLPETYILVYAPRNAADTEVIERIIERVVRNAI